MKPVCIVVLSILLCPVLRAEPPAKLDGFASIPFGSSVEQVKSAMDARGVVLHPAASTGAHLEFAGGRFNNEPAGYWHFYFVEGKLYKASVSFSPRNHEHLSAYERVKKAISDKYGKPFQETKTEMDSEELFELVRSGKIVLEANWRVVAPSSRSIACNLFRRSSTEVFIRIIYQDDVIDAQISGKQKDDI